MDDFDDMIVANRFHRKGHYDIPYYPHTVDDMGASRARRQAQDIAGYYMDDVNAIRALSQDRDRRAMSHVDRVLNTTSPVHFRRARSSTPVYSTYYSNSGPFVPPMRRRSYSRYRHLTPTYDYQQALPTSSLKAHLGPPKSIVKPTYNWGGLTDRDYRRVYSYNDLAHLQEDGPGYEYRSLSRGPAYGSRCYTTEDVHYPVGGTSFHHHRRGPGAHRHYHGARNHLVFPGQHQHEYNKNSAFVKEQRRRVERRMDNLLDYKLPPAEYYQDLRKVLRGVNDKMNTHKQLIDRYAAIDMSAPASVEDRINAKYNQLADRSGAKTVGMPGLNTDRSSYHSSVDTSTYNGPSRSMSMPPQAAGGERKQLHSKISKLLCKTKSSGHA